MRSGKYTKDGTTYVTNNVPRELFSWSELSEKAKENFDYIADIIRENPDDYNPYAAHFVEYLGEWYDLDEFTITPGVKAAGWNVVQADSYFSATLCRYFDREGNYMGDYVVMGRCWS